MLDPPTKHKKDISAKLVLHIYKRTDTQLNTAIGQLIVGAIFFGMRSCEHSATPKGKDKRTRILQKGNIRFYRKRRQNSHNCGSSIKLIRYPQHSAHRKMGQKCHSDTVADNNNPLPSAHLGGNHHPTGLIFGNNK